MADTSFLDWPFFDNRHRELAAAVDGWAAEALADGSHGPDDVDGACRDLVARLGAEGWLKHCVPSSHGGASERLDVRSLCLLRETLARHAGLADFCLAMQGLGTGPVSLFGTDGQKDRILPPVRDGKAIAAFALSEAEAGSAVAALATEARRDGNGWLLNGSKTWISNAGIADHYVVFARTGEAPGAKGLSAFIVDAGTEGFAVTERFDLIAPHPLGTLTFEDCRLPADSLIGEPGEGFKIAMATLDVFRPTVGAAALGFARRALDEAVARASERQMFGRPLSDLQMTQARIADMATAVDASALLVYRAAWAKDAGAARISREASMAKMHATESAQAVIDGAVQIFGALGVVSGVKVEELYREIRALRIYEGATEVQKLIIARQTLEAAHG